MILPMRLRVLLLGSLCFVVALGSGCVASRETRDGADALRDAIGTPSWASSVDVSATRDGQLADEVQVTVSLAATATPSEVAAFVVDLPSTAADAGLSRSGLHQLAFVSDAGARLEISWQPSVDEVAVLRAVFEWFKVELALGPAVAATLPTDGGASYVISLGEVPPGEVATTYSGLASIAEPDSVWQVTATSQGLALDLSGSALPTAELLSTWSALLAALTALPADLPAARLSLHLLDRIVADLVLVAPDDTTDDTFAVTTYGAKVWPVVQPQLRAMAALPDEWSYFASWVPASTPTSENLFVSLLSDQEPVDNGDESTRWSLAAEEYVRGL